MTEPPSTGRRVLLDAANRAALFDEELEATLRDVAGDYAGPQVSDEEGDRK